MRTYDVSFADLAERPTAVVRGHVPHDGIGPFIGSAFGEVLGVLAEAGVQPEGPPFARYRLTDDGFDVEAGFPVAGPVATFGRVVGSSLPTCRAARVVHHGSYAELAGAYDAAVRWIDENACRQDGDAWEVYLDEPDVPEHRTEVFVPCVPAHR